MVRPLSVIACAAVAECLFGVPNAARGAEAIVTNSLSELQGCIGTASQGGPVECRVTEYVTRSTSGSGTIATAIYPLTLPTSRKLDITVSFDAAACLVWDHTGGAEPGNANTPVRILEFVAPSQLVANSRLRLQRPCVIERRDGVDGGSVSTLVTGISITGAGSGNLKTETIEPRVRLSSTPTANQWPYVDGVAFSAVQPTPPALVQKIAMAASISDPSNTIFGIGPAFGPPNEFTAETYPGSGVSGQEIDNQFGFFYNKTHLDGLIVNPYEYTFDDSFELSYRSTLTGGNTWLEQNYDLSLPYMESTVTGGVGFNPAVGSYLTFSGGGTGKVLSWNSGTGLLKWVHHFGATKEGETVTGTGGTKTLGFVSRTANSIRPFGWSFDTVTGDSQWIWLTRKSVPTVTLAIQDGRVGVNIPGGQVYAGALESHGENPGRTPGANYAANWFEYVASTGANDGIWTNIWVDMNLGGTANANGLGNTKGIHVRTPTLPPAYNVVWDHAAIEIGDQKGIGRNTTSAIRIAAQSTYGGAGTTIGNVDFLGGNWNNGHLVMGGYGGAGAYGSGDHIWMDQTNNRLRIKSGSSASDNAPVSETDGQAVSLTIASGARAMATSAIAAGACNTADASITATGAVSTDVVRFSPNADPGLNSGLLTYTAWAGTGVISFRVCNPSAASITPAAVTINWQVVR